MEALIVLLFVLILFLNVASGVQMAPSGEALLTWQSRLGQR